jgi:hypothetical protein
VHDAGLSGFGGHGTNHQNEVTAPGTTRSPLRSVGVTRT